jgi:phosphotransferase system enzyme I (PtsI)
LLLTGKGAAPGIAVGRVYVYNKNFRIPAEAFVKEGEQQSQLDRYLTVKKQALQELEGIRFSLQKIDPGKAEIFIAHQEIVEDIIINDEIPAKILKERWAGDWAIYQVYQNVLDVLRKTPDPLISERASDFDDVRALLLRLWYGQENDGLSALKEPVIIAAHELMPSDTAGLNRDKVLAIITEAGGVTSHTAIIAKSYGIPAVLGIEGLLDFVKQGQLAAVNAEEGTVILDPEESVAGEYIKKNGALNRGRQDAELFRDREGRTLDGVKIDIGLNISGANDNELKAETFVDFAGLFRTEFLYMGRNTLPAEEEQFKVYRRVLECFGEKPVILRTLDIGGDKQLSSMTLPREENPFLGNRALRFCFSNPEIFKAQIRAALRAAVYGDLWLMLPMVGSIDDIRRAKEQIALVGAELKKEGKQAAEVKIGIMIEIPSIALVADLAAKEVDFASIGSNDLCQYLCAADRMNNAVESYYQSYHPAMFRIIKKTAAGFTEAGKPISICGELGGDPAAAPALIGLGIRKLSMGEASVAEVKRAVASVTLKHCEEIAAKVLSFSTAAEIENFLSGKVNKKN